MLALRQYFNLPRRLLRKLKYKDVNHYVDCIETVEALMKLHKPTYICDIGGYKGTWSYTAYKLCPTVKHVVFFEPQEKFIKDIETLEMPNIKKVIYHCGLGNTEEEQFIKGGTHSASFLDISKNQTRYFPKSVYDKKEKVKIRILDTVYKNARLPYPDTIKIDVQGFELKVLKGGLEVLKKAHYLIIELSLQQFYKNQPSLAETISFLGKNNYVMVSHGYELRWSKNPGVILQMDGIFKNMQKQKA